MKKFLLILFICLPAFVFAAEKSDLNKVKRETEQGLYTKFIQQIITDYSVQNIPAENSYQNLIKQFPLNKNLQRNYFLFILKSGKLEDAYKYGLSIIQNNDPEILKMMGYLCIGLNKYDEALQYLETLKEENFLKGIAYYEKGDRKNALEMFAKASNDRPVEMELISYFREDRKNQENVLDAIFYLKKIDLQVEYNYILVWYVANLYESFSVDDAIEYYNKILQLNPSKLIQSLTFERLGNIAFNQGNYDKALYYLQNAEKNNFVLNKIAQIYEERKDYKSAAKYQQNKLRLSSEYDQFNDKKSLKILKKLQKENPLDAKINFYLSIKYFLMDDFVKAISYMNINAHNKEIYSPLVREMLEVERIEIDNKQKLKFSKNQISEKVNEYLDTLSEAYFDAKLKLSSSKQIGSLFVDLKYNKTEGAKLKLLLNDAVPVQEIELSKEAINDLKDMEGDHPQVLVSKFIYLITRNQNHKITTDKYSNVTCIENGADKLYFKKSIDRLNLPYKLVVDKEIITINYLDFRYEFKEKAELRKKMEEFNESKS